MQNHNLPLLFPRQPFQFLTEIQFFTGEQFMAESADGSKCGGFAKNKRTRRPMRCAADEIPKFRHDASSKIRVVQAQRAAARDRFSFCYFPRDIREEFRARTRISIDEDQPIAGGRSGSAVSRAGNLIDRLENNIRSTGAGNFCGPISRIVVANNHFSLPAHAMKCVRSRLDPLQRLPNQLFFVERGHHDGNLHLLALTLDHGNLFAQNSLAGRQS